MTYQILYFGGNSGRPSNAVRSVSAGGATYDLKDTPLVYGKDDSAISGRMRTIVEGFENQRWANKIEYGQAYDSNGYLVGQGKGGSGSARVKFNSYAAMNAVAVMTHNHPAKDGVIGGTFSDADVQWLLKPNTHTIRATSVEGTYSMTRKASFKGQDLLRDYRSFSNKNVDKINASVDRLNALYDKKSITGADLDREWTKLANQAVVDAHNWLRANQSKYGYSYTLERRR